MPLVNWNRLFETDIEEIDNQHKRLVELLNQVYDASKEGRTDTVLNKVLAELINYTHDHFGTEERLMIEKGYPDYSSHKKEHESLTREVQEFQDKYIKSAKDPLLAQELTLFLKGWLTNHIVSSDKRYVPFFKSKGIR